MPRGDKSAYSDKQKRQAEHIEQSYENKGVSKDDAEARAWATINKQSGGGEKSGSGMHKSHADKKAARQDSARRAVATKQEHASPNTAHVQSQKGEVSLNQMTVDELRKQAAKQGISGRSKMKKNELIQRLS